MKVIKVVSLISVLKVRVVLKDNTIITVCHFCRIDEEDDDVLIPFCLVANGDCFAPVLFNEIYTLYLEFFSGQSRFKVKDNRGPVQAKRASGSFLCCELFLVLCRQLSPILFQINFPNPLQTFLDNINNIIYCRVYIVLAWKLMKSLFNKKRRS